MAVTPDLATRWLEGNVHNRPLRQSTVERYARDMADGKWRLTHQGIAFDDSEQLIDGQHRLWAVVESKSTIEFLVTRGLDMSAQEYIDGGEKRTTTDVLSLRGEKASPLTTGIAVMLAKQVNRTLNPTRAEQLDIWQRHRDAILFAVGTFTRNVRGIRTAPVLTPVARASYTYTRPDLIEFGSVLCDGVSSSKRHAPIIMLRNLLLERNPKRSDIYPKTSRALFAFLTDEPIKTLYASSEELFPLPEELKKRGKKR
jgi:hypothetical protein